MQIAELAAAALAEAGAPQGTFGLVTGFDAGLQAVDSPLIRAVAFTGSQAGGMALVQRAAGRGVPVFAEMGTVNPVLVTPAAAADGAAVRALAAGFTGSFTLGAGQFCTKPGLLLAPAGSGLPEAVRRAVADVVPAPLLTAGIAGSYRTGLAALTEAAGAPVPPADAGPAAGWHAAPELVEVRPEQLVPGSRLLEECFGPVALICEYEDFGQALALAAVLQPSLAASVFTGGDGDTDAAAAVAALVPRVGRVAVNTWPTGVANTWAQQHGGPWPATSRPEATSVGAGALERFVRPVAVQNAPEAFLPPPVAPENPWGIPQRIDGVPAAPGTD
ncbi:Alpha-ketoglutaric semialdehyde dehydrogenase [Arthrobacter saudimassiliensis]|uniref:Alpha-ketoglutaric semialdehyde dehydrogenase n=1 Tax=Arthrobacter saudimassiliensis TaxID=1461584 RepID=A0A078MPW6_9MICC|nr:Alpha-ketoglutaric semialdehyde dehydrogenase [Arthrobacter saudimassiliensis]